MRYAVVPGHTRPAIALDGTWETYLDSRPGPVPLQPALAAAAAPGAGRGQTSGRSRRPSEVRWAMAALTELHARRWRGQHTSTIFSSSAAARRFYAEAARKYAERGMLDLTLLEVDGRPVAGSLGFVDRDTYYYYLPAWEPELAPLAPSSLLLAHLVERAYERGLQRFDFMLGDEPYKARWATEERQTVNLVVSSPTLRGQAAFAALVGTQQARRRARSSPMLQRARRHWLGQGEVADQARLGVTYLAPDPPLTPGDLARMAGAPGPGELLSGCALVRERAGGAAGGAPGARRRAGRRGAAAGLPLRVGGDAGRGGGREARVLPGRAADSRSTWRPWRRRSRRRRGRSC